MRQAGRRQLHGRNCPLLFQQCAVQVRAQLLFSAEILTEKRISLKPSRRDPHPKAGSSVLTTLLLSAVTVPRLCRRQCSNICSPKGGNSFSLPVVIHPPIGGQVLMGTGLTSMSPVVGRDKMEYYGEEMLWTGINKQEKSQEARN